MPDAQPVCNEIEFTDAELDKLMKFDPIGYAEDMMGGDRGSKARYDDITMFGMFLAQDHAKLKEKALTQRGDVHFSSPLGEYIKAIEKAGFELILKEPFTNEYGEQAVYMYARRDGLLLFFDTYMGKSVNSAKLYYNWLPHDMKSRWDCTSSGSYKPYDGEEYRLWVGDHDGREALLTNIRKMESKGTFLSKWLYRPHMWLCRYEEYKTEDKAYDAAGRLADATTEARIAKLPEWVRDMITPDAV